MSAEPPRPLLKPDASDPGTTRRILTAFGLLGAATIALVLGIDGLKSRQARAGLAAVRNAAEIRVAIATSHVWLEQLAVGDHIDTDEIWHGLRHAAALAAALRSGDPALADDLQREAVALEAALQHFSASTLARQAAHERGESVGPGTPADAAYDREFRDLLAACAELQAHVESMLALRQARLRQVQLLALAAWGGLLALAAIGLRRLERRRRGAEEALRDREAQIVQAQKMDAVGRLAGGVAHDINNYLAAIRAQCELLLRKELPEERRREKLTAAVSAVDRASTLIQRLLAFARRQPAHPEIVDLNAAIGDLRPMLEQHVGEDVALEIRLAPDLGSTRIDLAQFEQILVNLVVNARDAMPRGGRLTIATAREQFAAGDPRRGPVSKPGDYVTVSISDTGTGVPAAIRDQIFEPFFTTKAGGGHSGLGLATAYGLVKQHGGNVRVADAPYAGGVGSRFTVYLSRVPDEAPPKSAAEAHEPDRESGPGVRRILLVEDSVEVREATRALLESGGCSVVAVASGADGLAVADASFDAVVTDVVMPGMSGPAMVEELARRGVSLPVVFVSGYSDSVAGTRGFLHPGAELLQKPFSSAALFAKLRQAVREHREFPS